MSLKNYDIKKIICPVCRAQHFDEATDALTCKSCAKYYAIHDGIPVLLVDNNIKTQLEEMDYDAIHNVNDNSMAAVTENWKKIFSEFGIPFGDVLELGAGTGALTTCLAQAFGFSSVHASDISHKFLLTARQRIAESNTTANFYVCDANNLPFHDGSFDAVVGHSVLHHFLDYEKILAYLHGLLRPGGAAIFFEPVLQGKAKLAMMLQLVTMMDNRAATPCLDEDDKSKIEKLRKHITKSLVIDDRARLATMEDKYIFDVQHMKTLGKQQGFSEVQYRNWISPDGRFEIGLEQHLLMAGIAREKIEKFIFISRAYRENVIRLLPDEQYTPMGFFVFKK